MRVRNKRTATETSGADVQSSRKKLRKTLEGVGIPSPPPPSTTRVRVRDSLMRLFKIHQFAPGHEQLLLFSHQKDTTFLYIATG